MRSLVGLPKMVYQKTNQIVEKFDQQLGLRNIRHGLDKSPTFSDPPKWTASLKQEGAKSTLFDTLSPVLQNRL